MSKREKLKEALDEVLEELERARIAARSIPELEKLAAMLKNSLTDSPDQVTVSESNAYSGRELLWALNDYLDKRRGEDVGIKDELLPVLSDTIANKGRRLGSLERPWAALKTKIGTNAKRLGLIYDKDRDTIKLPKK